MEEQNKNQDIIDQYLQGDGEVLKENGVAPHQEQQAEQGAFKNRYWKFMGAFLTIIILSVISIPFISNYMKAEQSQQYAKATDQLYKQDLAAREQLRNDTNGGKTPEETLRMFIAALKDGNIEKAKLYYSLYPENRSAMFKERLDQLNKEGKITELIGLLGKIKEEKGDREDSIAWFSYIDNNKSVITIELSKAIQFSNIWKIKSLAY